MLTTIADGEFRTPISSPKTFQNHMRKTYHTRSGYPPCAAEHMHYHLNTRTYLLDSLDVICRNHADPPRTGYTSNLVLVIVSSCYFSSLQCSAKKLHLNDEKSISVLLLNDRERQHIPILPFLLNAFLLSKILQMPQISDQEADRG